MFLVQVNTLRSDLYEAQSQRDSAISKEKTSASRFEEMKRKYETLEEKVKSLEFEKQKQGDENALLIEQAKEDVRCEYEQTLKFMKKDLETVTNERVREQRKNVEGLPVPT